MRRCGPLRTAVIGFTLLEMLAVLLIMVLGVGLLAFGVNHGLANARDKQAGRDLTFALRNAHSAAVLQQQAQLLRFDLSKNAYQAPGQTERVLPEGMFLRLTTAAGLAPAQAVIEFYPSGASSGGNVYLQHAGRAWRIDIPWLTGVATWHEVALP